MWCETRCRTPPSSRTAALCKAPQRRTAFVTTASKTGWTSVGRARNDPQDLAGGGLLLEGLGEGPVADLQLLEQPDVLDRDHRLVGEGLEEHDLAVGEALIGGAAKLDGAERHALAQQGHAEDGAEAHALRVRAALGELGRLILHVRHVDGRGVQHRATPGVAAGQGQGEFAHRTDRNRAVVGDEHEAVTIAAAHRGIERLAQAGRALDDRVEHRLDVGRRARDDPEDLAGRGLLLQGLGEVVVPRLQLPEEPDVLERDHRLVREGLQQRDLGVGERLRSAPALNRDRADRDPVADHRDREQGAEPDGVPQGVEDVGGILAHVRDVGGAAAQERAAGRGARGGRARVRVPQGAGLGGVRVVERLDPDQRPVVHEHARGVRSAQGPGVLDDGLETAGRRWGSSR